MHGFNDVRQTELCTAEPQVPEPSAFEVKVAITNLKSHKSPGIDQISAELIKAECGTFRFEKHKLIISIWKTINCLRSGRDRLLHLSVRRAIKQIVVQCG